jgi:hypothetical protein
VNAGVLAAEPFEIVTMALTGTAGPKVAVCETAVRSVSAQ